MKILCLYNNECAIELFHWIENQGHEIILWNQKLAEDWCVQQQFDLSISYTYRFILSEIILNSLGNNVVNIHNSYLPWNRGADPNLWSIIENSPRGVTLHYMDKEIDKGYIIAQRLMCEGNNETLKSSYYNLDTAAKELLKEAFGYYEFWNDMKKKSIGKGSYHSIKDGSSIHKLIDSYDMTIVDFKKKLEESYSLK